MHYTVHIHDTYIRIYKYRVSYELGIVFILYLQAIYRLQLQSNNYKKATENVYFSGHAS